MCEIFGVSAPFEFAANEYLREFFSHSEFHPHGWGLACISKNCVSVEKESTKASTSHYLRGRLTQPAAAKIILAHIRYATIGNVDYKNCHPFTGKDNTGRRWTLIHNGTIFDYAPLNPYVKKQRGDTDSERLFLYLIDRLNAAQNKKGSKLPFEERFELFDKIISDMAKGNKLNLIFTDGKYVYAHTNCRGTLHYLSRDGVTIISTRPLDSDGWQPFPFTQLNAFYKGRLIKSGTVHNNEYFESEEAMKLLYQIFANL